MKSSTRVLPTVDLSLLSKANELKSRIWFTLLALIVYRFGAYVPIPNVDPFLLEEIANQNAGGILGMFNVLSGGALGRMTIFALSMMPYITSSIIIQVMTSVYKPLEMMKKDGESGRRKINQYTRFATVFLSAVQGYGIAIGLEAMVSSHGNIVLNPGMFFRISTVVTLTGGTLFLMWLGEQITSRGIGNGISLIIFSGIVAGLPSALGRTFELSRTGAMSPLSIIALFILAIGLITFIIFMERSYRKVFVQYPKRQVGNKIMGGEVSHIPFKLNTTGVIPPIFASSLLLLPLTLSNFALDKAGIVADIVYYLGHGKPLYIALYALLIVFFCFFYTAIVFNPTETADNLKKNGGFIPGHRPGPATAEYFDYVLTRLTVIGAAYITIVCVLPEILIAKYSIPFYLGGTSILIVVNVATDTLTQVQTHLFAHQYEGLIKKARLRGVK